MTDGNAGWAGDRDRLADVAGMPPAVWRQLSAAGAEFGARVALPTESAAEADRRLLALERELAPRGEMGRLLVRRIAVSSLRLDRAVEQEAAALAAKVRRAEADFDEARLTEADHLMGWISSEPATHHRRLTRTPEGVDRLVATLRGLRHDLQFEAQQTWTHGAHALKLDECTGRRYSVIPASRGQVLAEAITGDFHRLAAEDGAGLNDDERKAWAREELGRLIDGEVDRLLAHRATLDHQAIALDRAGAAQRAAFDPEPAAILARRYEASAERSMFRALRELRLVNAEAKALGIEAAPPVPAPLLASFRAEGANPDAPPLASFRVEAQSPLVLPPGPPEDPTAARVAALADQKAANCPALIGFVPLDRVTGPAGTNPGAPGGPQSRGCSRGSAAHTPR